MEEKSKVSNQRMVEFQWLHNEESLKIGLAKLLNCSGQLLKKYFSSSKLSRPIFAKSLMKLDLNLVNHLNIYPFYEGPQLKIIAENESYLVVHKSFGIHCHPLKYEDKNTVLNYLVKEKKWDALNVNSSHYDRGLLYRLDEGTSGVLVLAKTEKKFDEIRNDFFQVVKEKYYLAIVKGDFDREGRWEHFFSPYGVKGSKQLVGAIEKKDHSRGVLECLKVQYMKGYSLILVRLKTGLRHQIRAQLAFLGFPILGDTLYGGVEEKRIYLHAWRYKLDGELFQDNEAELFDNFVDLNSAFQVGQDMINRIEGI